MKERVLKIISKSIDALNQEFENQITMDQGENTILFGEGGVLDSIGLVNLIAKVEEEIEDEFDDELIVVSERAVSQKKSPFKTIGRLADYIVTLMEEKNEK